MRAPSPGLFHRLNIALRLSPAAASFPPSSKAAPLQLVLQLFAWSVTTIGRLVLHFHILLISLYALRHVWNRVLEYVTLQLVGHWEPAFPQNRTYFIVALITVPIWSAGMAGALAVLAGVRYLWRRLGRGRTRLYDPLADFESEGGSPRRLRPPPARRSIPWLFFLWCGFVGMAAFGVYMRRTYELPIDHRFKADVELANRELRREGYGTGEKIFLAAMFYNNAGVLPYWITEVTKLINYLGPDNVFVSIVESNSGDETATLLEAFDGTLASMGVSRSVLTRDTSIPRPQSMETKTPRIEFLAAVRNLVMKPLATHTEYTRVVFSNDVFIEAESIVELIQTKEGDYDMACGLDLAYWGLYDQWVIRDRLGGLASTVWPYFQERLGYEAVMADEPAPVFSCWNGIVSFKSDPFLPPSKRHGQLSTSPLSRPLLPTHPSAATTPANMTPAETPALIFRASTETECFSSESFLLPYDYRRRFGLEKIYANPRVINSYTWEFYVWFKYVCRHWMVKWWIENVESGGQMFRAKMILGNPSNLYTSDGFECHPWR
ncbi:unnamed protein product [Mycena citricolor]|uniref:Glycosyltransferase family 69 protein n=1 Tax=Mycena citricolor TaxID=2018698 RepID=A0AAD2HFW7_9AGAR|nr:unnamed protein product [Mycena citricolor]CAK5273362.1 unnamed protein product [Mycena citricolor]